MRRTAEARSRRRRLPATVCVLGHQADEVRQALEGLDLQFAENPDFAAGLSTSLKAGIAALPPEAAGAMVCLGDMPAVECLPTSRAWSRRFREAGGNAVVRATHNGKRGNPVLMPRALFAHVAAITGDTGAPRHIIEAGTAPIVDLEIGPAASLDIDTPPGPRELGRQSTLSGGQPGIPPVSFDPLLF